MTPAFFVRYDIKEHKNIPQSLKTRSPLPPSTFFVPALIEKGHGVETQATVSTANTGSLTPQEGSSSAEGGRTVGEGGIRAPPLVEPLTKASAECCSPQVSVRSVAGFRTRLYRLLVWIFAATVAYDVVDVPVVALESLRQ